MRLCPNCEKTDSECECIECERYSDIVHKQDATYCSDCARDLCDNCYGFDGCEENWNE